jgi:hypothetical protein
MEMVRYATWVLLLVGLGVLASAASGAPIYEIDYAKYDVKITDTKSIVTEATDFGFYTGPNILIAKRGDAIVEIPFRKIRVIEVGTYIPSKGYYPCTVTPRRGKAIQVHVERIEGQRYLGGNTNVGTIRIRLGQLQRLDLLRLSHTDEP